MPNSNNTAARWILVAITLATVLIAIGAWTAKQEGDIGHNATIIDRHTTRIDRMEECQIRDGRTLSEMSAKLDVIHKWVLEKRNGGE